MRKMKGHPHPKWSLASTFSLILSTPTILAEKHIYEAYCSVMSTFYLNTNILISIYSHALSICPPSDTH
jgi:hypothetical protein